MFETKNPALQKTAYSLRGVEWVRKKKERKTFSGTQPIYKLEQVGEKD